MRDFGGERLGRGGQRCRRRRDRGARLCYFHGFNLDLRRDQPFKALWFSPCAGADLPKHKIPRRLCPFSRWKKFNLKDKRKAALSRGLCGSTPRSFWGRFPLISAPSEGKLRQLVGRASPSPPAKKRGASAVNFGKKKPFWDREETQRAPGGGGAGRGGRHQSAPAALL